LAVPAQHRLGRDQEGAPSLPRQVTACGGEKEAVAPPKPRPADLPMEQLQLMAQDHDLQVLGVLGPSHEQREDSLEDQGHERPHHGGPPAPEKCLTLLGSTVRTPILNKCTLQSSAFGSRPAGTRGSRSLVQIQPPQWVMSWVATS